MSPAPTESAGTTQAQASGQLRVPPKDSVFLLRGLGKTYGQGDVAVQALRDVDLEIASGEFIVMLGPSGSGKSTLLNLLGGLDVPTAGQWSFQGREMSHASEAELTRYRRAHVGFVFQFYNLIPSLTVHENVALVAGLVERPMPVEQALAQVDLTARARHFPSQLSGGEQQRVAIARAVVKQPEVLLCDEPTGALDCATGKRVLQALLAINAELGTTVVVITHNAAIADLADRVVRLVDGRVASIEQPARRARVEDIQW